MAIFRAFAYHFPFPVDKIERLEREKGKKMSEDKNRLQPIRELSFRDIAGHLLYVEDRKLLEQVFPVEKIGEATGMVVCGYIEETKGLCCQPAALVQIVGDDVKIYPVPEDKPEYEFRFREEPKEGMLIVPMDRPCMNADFFAQMAPAFQKFRVSIHNQYATKNRHKMDLRNLSLLDPYRKPGDPDLIRVEIHREGFRGEAVWVRCEYKQGLEMFGKMVAEPLEPLGYHKDEVIGFRAADDGDGLHLLATGNKIVGWK